MGSGRSGSKFKHKLEVQHNMLYLGLTTDEACIHQEARANSPAAGTAHYI